MPGSLSASELKSHLVQHTRISCGRASSDVRGQASTGPQAATATTAMLRLQAAPSPSLACCSTSTRPLTSYGVCHSLRQRVGQHGEISLPAQQHISPPSPGEMHRRCAAAAPFSFDNGSASPCTRRAHVVAWVVRSARCLQACGGAFCCQHLWGPPPPLTVCDC